MDLPSFRVREKTQQGQQLLLGVGGNDCGEVHVEELLSLNSYSFSSSLCTIHHEDGVCTANRVMPGYILVCVVRGSN